MAKNPGIKLTAASFQAIENALDSIIKKAEEATQKITAMFDIDGGQMKTLRTLRDIKDKLDEINKSMNRSGVTKAGKKGLGSGANGGGTYFEKGYNQLFRNQQKAGFYRWLNSMAFKTMFGGPGGLGASLRGGNFLGLNLSKYGPGTTGLMAKYRVFQKPFPGSDRNVFSLGDLAASGQNIAYGAGSGVEGAFRSLTGSAIAVNKVFNGLASSIVSFFNPILGSLIGSVGDMFIGLLEKMSGAIAGVIGALTNLGTALIGMATRAVEAASDLTEAVNAARVIAGDSAAKEMQRYAMGIQRQYGLSQTDSMKIMGRMAGMMRNLGGFSQDESGVTATQLYRAAVDIGSVMNKSVEDVGNQLMSGFAGRLTPLRRSAIGITAQQLDQQAKARGIARPGVRTDLQARARQFVEEFSRQAGLFTGDLERTQFEFANQRRKFLGQFEALFVTVGRILEPFAKAVLIAANDLMSMVLDLISPFANTIKDNMVEMTVMERFSASIKAFAWYVLWAKNAIIEMTKAVWGARDRIVEWVLGIARQFANITIVFSKFSIAVINAFANFVERIGLVTAVLTVFETALSGLTASLRRMVGDTSAGRLMSLREDVSRKRTSMLEKAQATAYSDPASSAKLRSEAEALRLFADRIYAVIRSGDEAKMDKYFESLTGQNANPFGATAVKVRAGADQFERLVAEAESYIKASGVKVGEGEFADFFKKIQPATSFPNTIAPAPEMAGGRLVQYFSPSAFRDAIQERESGPMQATAKNTGDILTLLQTTLGESLKGNVRRQPAFNMLAPVTLP